MQPSAKVVADSISSKGVRLTTVEAVMHRFVLAEFNTHRVFCLAGDSLLEFDLPGGVRNGSRRVFRMRIDEFVDKWHNGAAPRRNNPKADGSLGVNRQPIRQRLAGMRIRQLNEVTGLVQTSTVLDCVASGTKSVYEVRAGKHKVAGSRDHLVYTPLGWRTIGDLQPGDEIVIRRFGKQDADVLDPVRLKKIGGVWRSQWQRQKRAELIETHGGCTKCEATANLHIHHIVPVHVDPVLAFVDSNVTLLCENCHLAQHSVQGWQGGTYLYGDAVSVSEVVYRGEEETFDLEIAGEFPNFLANGVVVHNSRNSASSRAIPVGKQVERVQYDPAFPLVWAAEQPGMQGGDELAGDDASDAIALWNNVLASTLTQVQMYLKRHPEPSTRLHKSLLNRLLEPFMWHTVIVTSTEWDNFFGLRCNPMAQPEIRATAEAMQRAISGSNAKLVLPGQWHTPYISEEDEELSLFERCAVSAARCARVSYLTHDGHRDVDKDLTLYYRLTTAEPPHASPLEHVATPSKFSATEQPLGNFKGWEQLRHRALVRDDVMI